MNVCRYHVGSLPGDLLIMACWLLSLSGCLFPRTWPLNMTPSLAEKWHAIYLLPTVSVNVPRKESGFKA